MCSRGSSQILKIVLVMLISGILLSEKDPKTYQLGLVFFIPKRYDEHPYPFPIAFFPPRSAPRNKDLPPVKKKAICPLRPPPQKSNVPSLRYFLHNSK